MKCLSNKFFQSFFDTIPITPKDNLNKSLQKNTFKSKPNPINLMLVKRAKSNLRHHKLHKSLLSNSIENPSNLSLESKKVLNDKNSSNSIALQMHPFISPYQKFQIKIKNEKKLLMDRINKNNLNNVSNLKISFYKIKPSNFLFSHVQEQWSKRKIKSKSKSKSKNKQRNESDILGTSKKENFFHHSFYSGCHNLSSTSKKDFEKIKLNIKKIVPSRSIKDIYKRSKRKIFFSKGTNPINNYDEDRSRFTTKDFL